MKRLKYLVAIHDLEKRQYTVSHPFPNGYTNKSLAIRDAKKLAGMLFGRQHGVVLDVHAKPIIGFTCWVVNHKIIECEGYRTE